MSMGRVGTGGGGVGVYGARGCAGWGVRRAGGAQSKGCVDMGCAEQRVHKAGGAQSKGCTGVGCTKLGVHRARDARSGGCTEWGCTGMGCAEQRMRGVCGYGVCRAGGAWGWVTHCAWGVGCTEQRVRRAKSARMGGARSWGCSDPPQPPQSGVMERSCGMDTSGPGSAAEEEEEKAPEQRPRTRSNPEGAEDRALSAQSSVGNRSEGEGEAASSEDSPQGTAAPDGTAWPGPAHPPPEVQVKTPRVNCPEKVVSAWIWGGGLSCGVRGSAVGVSPRSSAWTWLRRWLCPSWSRSMGE